MAQSNDLDAIYDGIDPSDIARTARRRRRNETEMDDFMPSFSNSVAGNGGRRNPADNVADRPKVNRQGEASSKKDEPTDVLADDAPAVASGGNAAEGDAPKFSIANLGVVKFILDWRTRAFAGCLLLLTCIFMLIAITSHYKHGYKDQSLVENTPLAGLVLSPDNVDENGKLMSAEEIKERDKADNHKVQNAGGPLGAWLAKKFMCNALGLGSLFFIVYAAMLALSLFNVRKCSFWSLTFKTLLLAITTSVVVGLLTYSSQTPIRWGGLHGHYINKLLMDVGTVFLAMMVSAALLCAVACVYLNELRMAWRKWTRAARHRRLQEQLRRERQRELQTVEVDEPEAHVEPRAQPQPVADTPVSAASSTVPDPEGFSFGDAASVAPSDSEASSKPAQELAPFNFYEEAPAEKQKPAVSNQETFAFFVDDEHTAEQSSAPEPKPAADEDSSFKFDVPGELKTPDESMLVQDLSDSEPKAEARPAPTQAEDFSVVAKEIEKADPAIPARMGSLSTPYDHRADLSSYKFPDESLLIERPQTAVVDMAEQQANKDRIVETLANYNIQISKIEATVGPTITLYEIVPAEGVRISQIKRLEDDIALSLSALGIRIVAPMPGKGTVGIEVPNKDPQIVSMHSVVTSKAFQETKALLPMAIGATISNEIFIADMTSMPHLLVAGATGMGKSVGLNAIIASLLYKKHPSELKFVLVDPKMVEFSLYSKLERHYLAKLPGDDDAVITEPMKVVQTLNSLCLEMDQRYALLKDANVRALEEYNKKYSERRLNPERGHRYLPYIVVVVDEFADLIMMAGKDVEQPIMRIAQKARAVGIHMIIATQRPATNVITGNIKANFPGRIAFRVIQMVDSRTILDSPGANQLIGKGDMLFSHNGRMERVQCAFISTKEVEALTDWIDSQVGYSEPYLLPEVPLDGGEEGVSGPEGPRDTLFEDAARYVVSRQMSSSSSLQRQFNIGYNRAARIMDQLEMAGIVGPANGAKPRNILVDSISLEDLLNTL